MSPYSRGKHTGRHDPVPEGYNIPRISWDCYTAILNGYERITVRNLPLRSFISGQRYGTLSLSILGRENLPRLRSSRVSTANSATSVWMNTGSSALLMPKKKLPYGEKPAIKSDLTVPCRISLPMNNITEATGQKTQYQYGPYFGVRSLWVYGRL